MRQGHMTALMELPTKRILHAYRTGQEAYRRGKNYLDCPYAALELQRAWESGWTQQLEQRKKEKPS